MFTYTLPKKTPLHLIAEFKVNRSSWRGICDINQEGTLCVSDPGCERDIMICTTKNKFKSTTIENKSAKIISFTPNGKRIVLIHMNGEKISLCDHAEDQKYVFSSLSETGFIDSIAISHDGSKLLCEMNGGKKFHLWDLESKVLLKSILRPQFATITGEEETIECMSFSSDDATFIVCGDTNQTDFEMREYYLDIWCIKTGTILRHIRNTPDILCISATKNPSEFLIGTHGLYPSIFDVDTQDVKPFTTRDVDQSDKIHDVEGICASKMLVFNKDETVIAYSDTESLNWGCVILADKFGEIDLTGNTEERMRLGTVSALSFSSDGKKLYSFNGYQLSIWSTDRYPHWTTENHRTFSEQLKKKIKLIVMEFCFTSVNLNGKRQRDASENCLPLEILFHIFSFITKDE